jgi:hypothetical protein
MPLPKQYFDDFLTEIRPDDDLVAEYKEAHETLRARLIADPVLGPIIVYTFLQGSYKRSTAVKPHKDKKADVDVVVLTRISKDDCTPVEAQGAFVPFLEEHYPGMWEPQGRSIGITTENVELDLVITSAPSEAQEGVLQSASVSSDDSLEEAPDLRLSKSWLPLEQRTFVYRSAAVNSEPQWKTEPLMIPDRDAECWEATHPLRQIQWAIDKNKTTSGHYINVVKALKWWRRVAHPEQKYPKGYPVEHLIGLCCPDGITSIEDGVVLTLETIVTEYKDYAARGDKPVLCDHGVPEHDVFHRLSPEDFGAFYEQVAAAAKIAREATDATTKHAAARDWRKLFGPEFPEAPPENDGDNGGSGGNGGSRGGFTEREDISTLARSRYS